MKYVTMLPFMDSEELKELAFKVLNKEEDVKGVNIVVLYPFLDRATMDEIVDKLIEQNDGKKLRSAIVFASKSAVKKIQEAIKSGKLTKFREESLLPFLGKDTIKEMFNDLIKKASVHVYVDEDDDEEDDE